MLPGNSTKGVVFEDILFEIIQEAEAIGLTVLSITSDMGPVNDCGKSGKLLPVGTRSQTVQLFTRLMNREKFIYLPMCLMFLRI